MHLFLLELEFEKKCAVCFPELIPDTLRKANRHLDEAGAKTVDGCGTLQEPTPQGANYTLMPV